jgi:2-succinyl-5-enolpyruvyl-6-hydroxy-3-cyclohexene-1-carboxylate synthase
MFGIEYTSANDDAEMKFQLSGFYEESKRPKLIEIFTPSTMNDQVLDDYFKYIT